MERLTVNNNDGDAGCSRWDICATSCAVCDHFTNMINKLAYYEDLDECGKVIRDGDAHKVFAKITINKEDIQELVDKKFKEISINIDKLIDEFVNRCRENMDVVASVLIEDIECIGGDLKKEYREGNEKIN